MDEFDKLIEENTQTGNKNDVDIYKYITEKQFDQMVSEATTKSTTMKNTIVAFFVGGAICTTGEGFINLYKYIGANQDDASIYATMTLILIAGIMTGFGLYSKLGTYAGAGSIVPITGFANSVVSPAIEFKKEGFITGTGTKMFAVAGPVIVYGILSSILSGMFLYCSK